MSALRVNSGTAKSISRRHREWYSVVAKNGAPIGRPPDKRVEPLVSACLAWCAMKFSQRQLESCDIRIVRREKSHPKGGTVLTVYISSSIGHTIRAYVVRKVIAAAVCYGAITTGELWKMFGPHSVALRAAVNKYHGLALAYFYVSKLSAVCGNPFDFVWHSRRR
jgi:hypothetical protein